MPRTPRLCGYSGKPKCFNLATVKGRCPDHAPEPYEGYRDRWKAARPPGWDALRNRVIREAKGLCENCGKHGSEVDHKIPVAQGGSWSRENLWLLCDACHDVKSQEDRMRGRRRRRRPR